MTRLQPTRILSPDILLRELQRSDWLSFYLTKFTFYKMFFYKLLSDISRKYKEIIYIYLILMVSLAFCYLKLTNLVKSTVYSIKYVKCLTIGVKEKLVTRKKSIWTKNNNYYVSSSRTAIYANCLFSFFL